jgi:hypothetical protein
MSNANISGHTPGVIDGTINYNGTLSQEIPLSDCEMIGMHVPSGWTNGTLSFQVSSSSDNSAAGGAYVDLLGSDGAVISVGPVSGGFAISGTVLEPLKPYHYVKVKSSIAQSGASIRIITKA